MPSVPLPMSGGLLFVPTDSVRPADISVESLMSIYVSMGTNAPQFLHAGVTTSAAHRRRPIVRHVYSQATNLAAVRSGASSTTARRPSV